MNESEASAEAACDALRATYAALNRNDIETVVAPFDPEIVWIESDYLSGKTYRGRAAVEAHFARARATWAEGTCEPDRLVAAGDKVLVFVEIHVRLKDETQWRDGRHVDAYRFRNGKVVEVRIFEHEREALAWAGIDASDPS